MVMLVRVRDPKPVRHDLEKGNFGQVDLLRAIPIGDMEDSLVETGGYSAAHFERPLVGGFAACYQLATQGLPLPAEVYYIEKIPVVMRANEIATVSLTTLALCYLATIYPALLASRLRPVDGLRYE